MAEQVNHPGHYGGDTTYETIKVIEAWGLGFNDGNAVKYISRAGSKNPAKELEDIDKAIWYLKRHRDNRAEALGAPDAPMPTVQFNPTDEPLHPHIKLNPHEIQSGFSRVGNAEGLIEKLADGHDGRNTWLMNYGIRGEARGLRERRGLKFDAATQSAELTVDEANGD